MSVEICNFCGNSGTHLCPDVSEVIVIPCSKKGCVYGEIARLKQERDEYRAALEAVRSQMCWERDRDQLSMGMSDLHDDVTKVLGRGET